MMNSHRSDAEKKNSLIEDGKKLSINEVIKHNETINKSKILNTCKNV